MLDVHPPHHPTHGWRDFFIHIATIVVGLLIAIGLEQTVEAIHHRREAAELREALHGETAEILKDSRDTDVALSSYHQWLTHRIEQVRAAVWQHQPLAVADIAKMSHFDYPDDPLWRAAKTGSISDRLSTQESNAYSEVELLCVKVDLNYDAWRNAQNKRFQLEQQMPQDPQGRPDFSRASSEDLRNYLNLVIAEMGALNVFREWDRNLVGAEEVIAAGNLDLQAIFRAEKSYGLLDKAPNAATKP
jgi:hypothetical protein